jgi:hypothetical protein
LSSYSSRNRLSLHKMVPIDYFCYKLHFIWSSVSINFCFYKLLFIRTLFL